MKPSIILFDGVCNLCSSFVQFIIRHDSRAKFKFSSLQSEVAQKILAQFNIPPNELRTIVLVEDGKVYLRSRAVLRVARRLDGAWKISALFYIFPSFISDAIYNFISKYRYKVFGKRDTCLVPTPELKSRFL